ncbi:aspartyl protease family protein [Brevundimonas sp.]|uniref:aspartyl protease family protein n=1 Tax=Brevundimonas sp. TaxID=1871086 RepID=UPI0025F1D5C0|nr:aspartyl protease family protein [Brevundimonas sp.]
MRRLILLLSTSLLAVTPASADELSDLIARYREWRGGPAFEAMQGVRAEGSLSTAGFSGEVEMIAERDGSIRQRVDLGVFRSDEAVDGEHGWVVNQTGQVEDMAADGREDRRRDIALIFGSALEDSAALSLAAPVERDGRTWSVVAVDYGDQDAHELLIDPESGELGFIRMVRDRRESWVDYGDWRLVEGVRMPFEEIATSELMSTPNVVRWTEVDIDPVVPVDAFARPVVEARYQIAGGADTTGWIDYEFHGGNRIYLPTTVNGTDTHALLDSGAEMTVLDAAFARELGLETSGDLPAVGTGGVSSAQLAEGVTLVIGDLTLRDMTVAVIDLSAIAQALGRPLPVVLGKDAFNELIVDVDFPHHRIAFHAPGTFVAPSDAVEVPLSEATGGLRSVPVSIEGRQPVPFDFDIGNGGSLIIFPGYAEEQGLLDGRTSSTVMSGAVGGMREAGIATFSSVTFGGVKLRDVPAVLPPPGPSAVDSDRTRGNIGIGVLGRFRLITDYTNDRLWLVPISEAISQPFARNRLGLSLRKDADAIVVQYVARNSPASEGGWAQGERIVAIDGVPAADITPEALRDIINGADGRTVRLTLEGGEERSLVSRTYY